MRFTPHLLTSSPHHTNQHHRRRPSIFSKRRVEFSRLYFLFISSGIKLIGGSITLCQHSRSTKRKEKKKKKGKKNHPIKWPIVIGSIFHSSTSQGAESGAHIDARMGGGRNTTALKGSERHTATQQAFNL